RPRSPRQTRTPAARPRAPAPRRGAGGAPPTVERGSMDGHLEASSVGPVANERVGQRERHWISCPGARDSEMGEPWTPLVLDRGEEAGRFHVEDALARRLAGPSVHRIILERRQLIRLDPPKPDQVSWREESVGRSLGIEQRDIGATKKLPAARR